MLGMLALVTCSNIGMENILQSDEKLDVACGSEPSSLCHWKKLSHESVLFFYSDSIEKTDEGMRGVSGTVVATVFTNDSDASSDVMY